MARQSSTSQQGDVGLSIAVHRHLAGDEQAAAFAARGFTAANVERALRIASTPLADQEAAELRAGEVLIALRAPGVTLERVEVRRLLSDESPQERDFRFEGAGWFDAILHRPARELPQARDAEAYERGRSAFVSALESAMAEVAA